MSITSDSFTKEVQRPSAAHLHGTRECALVHAGGVEISKQNHAIDGAGAQVDSIFQVTGCCRILALFCHVNTAADSTTFSGVKFIAYDGTIATDITDTVDCSGAVANSLIRKTAALGDPLTFTNADQVRIDEPVAKDPFYPFTIVQKNGVDTFIQLSFTGDGDTDLNVDFHIFYEPMGNGSMIESV